MEETNKKEYSIIGTVTIGTDEYRDLIEYCKNKEAELKEVERTKSDYYWEKYKLKNELDEIKPKYDELIKFIAECDGVKEKLKLWRLENAE